MKNQAEGAGALNTAMGKGYAQVGAATMVCQRTARVVRIHLNKVHCYFSIVHAVLEQTSNKNILNFTFLSTGFQEKDLIYKTNILYWFWSLNNLA